MPQIRFGEFMGGYPRIKEIWGDYHRTNNAGRAILDERAGIPEAVVLSCMAGLKQASGVFGSQEVSPQRAVEITTHEYMPFIYAHDIWSLLPPQRIAQFFTSSDLVGKGKTNPLDDLTSHYGEPRYFNLADHIDLLSLDTGYGTDLKVIRDAADRLCGPDFQPDHRGRALTFIDSQFRGNERVYNIFEQMPPAYALEYLTGISSGKSDELMAHIFGWLTFGE